MRPFRLREQDKAGAAAGPEDDVAEGLARMLVGIVKGQGTAAEKRKRIMDVLDSALVDSPADGKGTMTEQTLERATRVHQLQLVEQAREREKIVKGEAPPTDPALRRLWLHNRG